MKYIITLLSCLALIIGCDTSFNTEKILGKPGDLTATEYNILVDRDTTLITANGALLKIPKGSLAVDKGNTVTLEIKEAYTLQQMIKAGLTTGSNGDPLSSGGMIYINAKDEQHTKIVKPLQVAIPSDFLLKEMKLYKGETTTDGSINWQDPVVLPENKQLISLNKGQLLFQNKCSGCHGIGKVATGPDLAQFVKRFPADKGENYRYYDHRISYSREYGNPKPDTIKKAQYYEERLLQHYGVYENYKCNLSEYFGKAPGSLFNSDTSSQDDYAGVFRYIQTESDRLNLPLPAHTYLMDCADSCDIYKKRKNYLQEEKGKTENDRQDNINNNGPLVEVQPDSLLNAGGTPTADFDQRVSPEYVQSNYYQFTISSFGWYNIDMLLKEVNGVEESELLVRLVGQYRTDVKLYLIIPSAKVYGEAGPTERNPEEFAFFYKNGKLPLPQNAQAYIMAVAETEDNIAFGIKAFTTTIKQEIEISLDKSTKEEFNNAIAAISPESLHIGVRDAVNAAAIRKADTAIGKLEEELKKVEALKPKNCDCDCGQAADSTAMITLRVK